MLLFQNIRPIAHDQVPSPAFTYFHYKFNWITSQVTESWKENSYLDGQQIMHEKNLYIYKCAMRLEFYFVWTQSAHSHSTYLILTLMLCTIIKVVIFPRDTVVCTVASNTILNYIYLHFKFFSLIGPKEVTYCNSDGQILPDSIN